jgi:hypothetical protein
MYDQQPKKGVLSMATLHENTLNFNKKMTVTNTGGNLSTGINYAVLEPLGL